MEPLPIVRPDGRRGLDAIRALSIEHTVFKRADGSAAFGFLKRRVDQAEAASAAATASTETAALRAKALAQPTAGDAGTTCTGTVRGPGAVSARQENPRRGVLSVELSLAAGDGRLVAGADGCSALGGFADSESADAARVRTRWLETGVASFVRSTVADSVILSQYPRSSILVELALVSADGGAQAALLNAATLALLDAGISMTEVVTAVNIAVLPPPAATANTATTSSDKSQIVVDPCAAEEAAAECVMTFAFSNVSEDRFSCDSRGACSPHDFDRCLEKAREACRYILERIRESLATKYGV